MPDFPVSAPPEEIRALKRELLRGGVVPAMGTRTLAELYDHFDDLESEAMASSCSPAKASAEAMERLGSSRALAREVFLHPEFHSWAFRWPWWRTWRTESKATWRGPEPVGFTPLPSHADSCSILGVMLNEEAMGEIAAMTAQQGWTEWEDC